MVTLLRPVVSRFSLCALSSLYSVVAALPSILLGMMWHAPVAAQAMPVIAQPASTRALLEDARRRLLENTPDAELGENSGQDAFAAYRLGPGDTLFVNVLRFPDLSFQNTIDLEGSMLIPLVGAMTLEGLTVAAAREQIRIALDQFIVDPQVDVILIAQRPVQVTLLGEVVRPGLYPLAAPQLSVALVSAGGATTRADLRTVRVRRQLVDGSIVEKDVDLFTPLQTASPIPDLQLADGDTIVVPTLTANADYDRNLIARSTLAQPQINVRVLNYATGARGGGSIGSVQLPNGSSFVDAISTLSLDLGSADLRNIALVRFDVQQGKAVSQELDGKKALMGDQSQNPMLEHNDVIVVGRNFVARVTYALNNFTQPFRDILGFVLFFQSLVDSASNLFAPAGSSSKD
ncbi:polysaccharide export protein [Leptolyngbya sp. NK1-12]|uniref:Polysaccharide export protein n=1 Tax=Leptolyngbya sp. NK1-12 TaxID=2547451 RepID=A0AA96WTI5_9CYAN|nr:polysaccharide biosynthesis/export family protein [Leptolyngbya sp. NK1-12]WNZ22692.1 polysaccharide export protein [Leptolyngbya sp. NK1-12]